MAKNFVNRIVISTCLSLPLIALTALSSLADVITISVINNSGKKMTAVYISPPDQEDWGDNELPEAIADREKQDFEWEQADYGGSNAGCIFDVRAEYEDGKSTDLSDVDLCSEASLNFK
ncbi:MAG TPA: hypothetical protein DCQ51_03395 [Planktothrix sp. UBA8407]|jgi:hypothetical protein|nr:hypothetical protein [Planktothrix sp. UBA8402]HAO10234.1 hypothetical protein [Planktothrix sp. UBA8407]HBK21698.1 hypothetical protein [Planktothrix sp. UBA10369]